MQNQSHAKRIERYLKGAANHWRIEIIFLLDQQQDRTLVEIAEALHADFRTIGEHTRKLHHAGLLQKKYRGRTVLHSLSPEGKKMLHFLQTFQATF